ncbi:metal ABC transporter permease [Pantoea sp. 9140]|uniref:metal ABC transporter permease n=1 Tax=Pantoea sp. 9140 TaxID=1500896 RepID=UPI00053505FA|nr:metal ABC transporter permease [Pantoea sp. 9140]
MWILDPFRFAFMNGALLIALVVAIPCALLSVFLVLKGWALMGDAMSHAVFPGIVLAWMAGLPLAVGAFVAGLFCAVASGFLQDNSRIKQDTVLGIVFSGMFAVGLILYIAVKPEVHLDHILFGDMLGITGADIVQTAIIALIIVMVIVVKWRDFMLFSFDPQQAQVSGLSARLLHYGLLCMVSLTIVATLKAVGIILSISLLIAPGAIAVLLTRRFSHALLVAVMVSVLVSLSGVYLSFFIDSAPAPTIVVLFAVVFVVAMVIAGRKTRQRERLKHRYTEKSACGDKPS